MAGRIVECVGVPNFEDCVQVLRFLPGAYRIHTSQIELAGPHFSLGGTATRSPSPLRGGVGVGVQAVKSPG